MSKYLFAAAAALASLLLPSCVQWEIGRSIRECAETRVGIDPQRCLVLSEEQVPLVVVPNGEGAAAPVPTRPVQRLVAPEVTYHADSPLVNNTLFRTPADVSEVTPTGAYRRVDMQYGKFDGWRAEVGERCELPHPERLEAWKPLMKRSVLHMESSLGTAERQRSGWYPLAAVAAAPFDYLIDPALSLACTPLFWASWGLSSAGDWVLDAFTPSAAPPPGLPVPTESATK